MAKNKSHAKKRHIINGIRKNKLAPIFIAQKLNTNVTELRQMSSNRDWRQGKFMKKIKQNFKRNLWNRGKHNTQEKFRL